jgi:hypothetical protein
MLLSSFMTLAPDDCQLFQKYGSWKFNAEVYYVFTYSKFCLPIHREREREADADAWKSVLLNQGISHAPIAQESSEHSLGLLATIVLNGLKYSSSVMDGQNSGYI